MNECDHIVGFHYEAERFVRKSEEELWKDPICIEIGNYIVFNFCPECGYKFTCHDKGIGHGFGLSGICIECGDKLKEPECQNTEINQKLLKPLDLE